MPKQCTCGHSSKYPVCDGSHKALDSAIEVRVPLTFNVKDEDAD